MSAKARGPGFSLLDEYAEGFQLLHMLRYGYIPGDRECLVQEVTSIVNNAAERGSKAGLDAATIDDAAYAFCAAVDEAVLGSPCSFRGLWEAAPLQLTLFGDQLAGEHFFTRLGRLRQRGKAQLAAMEIFHMCLLLGFRGRYRVDADDKLRYLTTALADEISSARGAAPSLAPHAGRPDEPRFLLRRAISPAWLATALLCLGGAGWLLSSTALQRYANGVVAGQQDLVKMPARTARVTITLP